MSLTESAAGSLATGWATELRTIDVLCSVPITPERIRAMPTAITRSAPSSAPTNGCRAARRRRSLKKGGGKEYGICIESKHEDAWLGKAKPSLKTAYEPEREGSGPDADRYPAAEPIVAVTPLEMSLCLTAAGRSVDAVRGVRRVALAMGLVGGGPVDTVARPVVEEDLPGVHHRTAHVDLEVDVGCTAAVPARINRVEEDPSPGVALLMAAQEPLAVVRTCTAAGLTGRRQIPAVPGIDARGVGMPDLHVGVLDRLAGVGVNDGDVQRQRQPEAVVGDVSAGEVVGDVVRPLGYFGAQNAHCRFGGSPASGGCGRR